MTAPDARRSAPAALRNRGPIAEVLKDWLPESGTVLEIASGTGEHALYFAKLFPTLYWQPSDADSNAIKSIEAWRAGAGLSNLKAPLLLNAMKSWPPMKADAVLCINMAHISPWEATLKLLEHARDVLPAAGSLIFYGPWWEQGAEPAASNLDFDAQLRARDSAWGIRRVEELASSAEANGFRLTERRIMPANNLMLRCVRNADGR
jgi:hypothetical protein